MDNLTHSLVGLAMARAGLNRLAPRTTALIVIAANAPDLDIVMAAGGQLAYLEHHRGWSHAMTAQPLIALALLPFWWLWARKSKPDARAWIGAFLAATVGSLSNPLLDWPNVYGTRLLLPFRADWLHLDIVYIVDLWIWLLLGFSAAAPLLSRLVNAEIGAPSRPGRLGAVITLLLFSGFLGVRFYLHGRAVETLNARHYHNETPRRVWATPTPFAPWKWQGIVETATTFHTVPVDLTKEFDPEAARVFYTPTLGARRLVIMATETARVFLDFSQVTLWQIAPAPEMEGAVRVTAHDLRFGEPESGMFSATWVLDAGNRLLSEEVQLGRIGGRD